MFSGFTDETIRFFLDLKFHNSTEWFHAHHDEYVQVVQQPFSGMIEALGPDMLTIDPMMEIRPHKCISRIHRDTRFSNDKSPYRDHLWFIFRHAAEPREKSLNFYFEFGPDRLGWGMGFWGENREAMDCFRRRIVARPEGVSALLRDCDLPGHFMVPEGNVFKRISIPPEVPEELKRWYISKDLYITKVMPDFRDCFSEKIVDEVRKDLLALGPLYRLFRGCYEETAETAETVQPDDEM